MIHDAFDFDRTLRRYPWVSRAINGEAVYGTVLTAGVASAFTYYNEGIAALTVRTAGTVLVFWAAHVYAEIIGNRDTGWRESVREALQRSAGLLWALLVPVATLTIAAVLQMAENSAVDMTLWASVATLALLGWWAARQREAPLVVRVVFSLGTAALGLALITLKALVH